MKKIFVMLLVLMAFVVSGCGGQSQGIRISMLDVGEGDAILIQTGKQTILIDTSDTDERGLLVHELEKFSVTKIDKLILTHPHADHIGNAKVLINPNDKEISANPYLKKISVAEVYDNGIGSNSPLYKSYIEAIDAKGIVYKNLTSGDKLDFGNGVEFKVFYPTKEIVDAVKGGRNSDANNESIVGALTYGDFSMLFPGDAESPTESYLVEHNAKDLECDVLKAGRHGRYTASSEKFLDAVKPSCVLISCGAEEPNRNTHGYPHLEPLQRYLEHGVDEKNIFCTRWNGTITITSDGKGFSVEPEKKEDWLKQWIEKKKKEGHR